jgi:hypothetical protein
MSNNFHFNPVEGMTWITDLCGMQIIGEKEKACLWRPVIDESFQKAGGMSAGEKIDHIAPRERRDVAEQK